MHEILEPQTIRNKSRMVKMQTGCHISKSHSHRIGTQLLIYVINIGNATARKKAQHHVFSILSMYGASTKFVSNFYLVSQKFLADLRRS